MIKRFWLVLTVGLSVSLGIVGFRTAVELKAGRSFYFNVESDIGNVMGATNDSRIYLKNAYEIYKRGRFYSCRRPLSSLIFVPFIPLGRYLPIVIVVLLAVFYPISLSFLAYLLSRFSLNKRITLAVLLALLFGTFYATRLILDGWIAILLSIWIILTFRGYRITSTLLGMIISVLRPEFLVLPLINTYIYKGRIRFLGISAMLVSAAMYFSVQHICGDQSHFTEWTARAYITNVNKNISLDSLKRAVENCANFEIEKGSKNAISRKKYTQCYREQLIKMLKKEGVTKVLGIVMYNVAINIFDLSVYFTKNNRLNRKYTFIPVLILTLLYDFILYISLMRLWKRKRYRYLIFLWIALILVYSLYYPFGLANPARWKAVLFPVEIAIIALSAGVDRAERSEVPLPA